MTRLENEVGALIATGVASDLGAVAENDHLVDEALHQNVAIAVARWNRVVIRAIVNQRLRGDPDRDFVAGFEWRCGKVAEHGLVGDEPLADCPLMTSGAFILTGEAALNEPGVQRLDRRRMRDRRQIIEPHELHQALNLAFIWHDRA